MLDCMNVNASVVMTIGVSSIGNDRMAVQCGGSVALSAVALARSFARPLGRASHWAGPPVIKGSPKGSPSSRSSFGGGGG